MGKTRHRRKVQPFLITYNRHSKGAAEADFVAAELNCYATTYAAPNVYRLLSDEAKTCKCWRHG